MKGDIPPGEDAPETILPVSPDLACELDRAAKALADFSGYVQVVCHDDADGICAGAVLTKALMGAGRFLRTKVVGRLDEEIVGKLAEERMGLYIFADIGSGYLDLLRGLEEETKAVIIVLDHHKVVARSDRIIQINCNDHGHDGSFDCSGSTMAFLFACAMNIENLCLIDLALAGAVGDKQKMYGFRGLNLRLAELGITKGLLRRDRGMDIYGDSIGEGLLGTYDPYFPGISGREEAVSELLADLGIEDRTPMEELSGAALTSLNSSLVLRLAEAGVENVNITNLMGTRYVSASRGAYIEDMASMINGCGSLKEHSLALGFCISPEKYHRRAREVSASFNRSVLEKLAELEGGVESLQNLDYFPAEENQFGGTAAGVAVRYITGSRRPLLSLTPREDSLNVSARGTMALVKAGLDLAEALSSSAGAVGGRGGGHPVASGATIPKDGSEKFMASVDAIVGKQLGED